MMEHDTDNPITLRIYRAPPGQWAGVLIAGKKEIGRVTGCESPEAVKEAAAETGFYPDLVEMMSD
jgi:hypothetical protein